MNFAKKILISITLVIMVAVLLVQPATAHAFTPPDPPTPVTVDGRVTDKGKPVVGIGVLAWCGDLDHFGGYGVTDVNGTFGFNNDSNSCPLGSNLWIEVFPPNDYPNIIAYGSAIVHTHTTVNIKVGEPVVTVPEYDWIGGAAAIAAGGGAIVLARRKLFGRIA